MEEVECEGSMRYEAVPEMQGGLGSQILRPAMR